MKGSLNKCIQQKKFKIGMLARKETENGCQNVALNSTEVFRGE